MPKDLPRHARVVVVGGGIAGCGVAYYLAKLGWRDVTVLERKTVSGGTTWHAAGLVTQFRASRSLIEIARISVDLYSRLEAETGLPTGFRRPGSITVARTPGRMDEIRKIASLGRSFGIEIEPITPKRAGEMWPLMRTDDLVGALHIPRDGQTNPALTALAMARGAELQGVKIIENVQVTGFRKRHGSVAGVVTGRGEIGCEYVVLAAGMWSRELGLLAGVNVPQMAAEHMYLVTNPLPSGVPYEIPSLRDPDEQIYFRRDMEEQGAILMGGFETDAKPWGVRTGIGSEQSAVGQANSRTATPSPSRWGIGTPLPEGEEQRQGGEGEQSRDIPGDYHFGLLEPDWDHFKVFWENAIFRVPAIEEAGINRFYVSAESFTPDNKYILGEAPELKNFYVATGLNSTGISAGAGVGSLVAQWIVDGHPPMDLTDVDIRRFHGFENSPKFLLDRTVESVGTMYGMHWPNKQMTTARGVRRSAIHQRLAARGACFGVGGAGWERPNWYAPHGVEPKYRYSYQRQNWFQYSAAEHRSAREDVALFDQSSFAKFLLQGTQAERLLQTLCANDVDVPPGRVVYTAMLNPRGGIEADLTVTRLSEDSYLIVTGGATATRDFHWIKSHIPHGAHTYLTDVTSAYGVLGVMGPNSRALLQTLTDADMSNAAFPYMTSKELPLGYATVRASRVTYVGELGWELYVPTEFLPTVYEAIVTSGDDFALKHAGYHAMNSLRIEKGYRAWGLDITDQETPLEAGLGFAVAWDKPVEFIGKRALLHQRERPLRNRLAMLVLDSAEPVLWGDEPIYRDGALVGRTTSGWFCHTVGRSVAMGYITNHDGVTSEFIKTGAYEIEAASERHKAKASLQAPYDPKGERVRG
ncbi:MAG: FAD-dependent oxidoreductase [SAR202 cluster bacterium]|nr:FAD-dependent oxidoreductase [SAR202 cluster bacterium]